MDSELLVIIVDTNPAFWGEQARKNEFTLSKCMNSVLVFANSHLMLNPHNKVAIIACHSNTSCFLYPSAQESSSSSEQSETNTVVPPSDGRYEPFTQLNLCVRSNLQQLVTSSHTTLTPETMLAGALSLALCYIHRVRLECAGGKEVDEGDGALRSKVLVVSVGEEVSGQYMHVMNCVFTAQRLRV